MQYDTWNEHRTETRWLDHNHRDTSKLEYRIRLGVQETRRTSTLPPRLRGGKLRVQHHFGEASL